MLSASSVALLRQWQCQERTLLFVNGGNINVVVVRQEQHTCKKLLNRSYSNAAAAAAKLHNAGIGNIAA